MAQILLDESAAPGTPAANKVAIYAKADGLPYSKDDAGTETALGGAPASADFLVKTANASLSAERVVTDAVAITFDWSVAGVVKAIRAALTGDVTAASDSNATTIVANAVGDTKLRDSGALSVVGRSANTTGDPADISAVAASGAVLRESGSTLGFGTVATAGLADNAVSDAKLRDSGALSVVGRSANTSGDPADISAVAASDAVLRESGSVVGFGTIATAGIAAGAVTEAKQTLADNTTGDVVSTRHGYAPKSPADATKFLNGAATPAYALVKDSDLSTSDITTNNVSTTKHGFAPKAPNDATQFLDGTGAFSVPAGGGLDYVQLQSFGS